MALQIWTTCSPESAMEHRVFAETIEEGERDHSRNLDHADLYSIG